MACMGDDPDLKLPTLYKKTKTGAIQEWNIEVFGKVIVILWGQLNGARQSAREVIEVGKNVGKKNETTPSQQAESEAKAKWEKQIKDGYVEDLEKAKRGEDDREGISPMLAHKFSDHGHKLVYPVYVQPKLDGHRCIAIITNERVSLWSRNREKIVSMPHIEKELGATFAFAYTESSSPVPWIFDGELFSSKIEFRKLSGLVRKQTVPEDHLLVDFNIFDLVNDHPWSERVQDLESIGKSFDQSGIKHLKIVPSQMVDSEDHLVKVFREYLSQKHEGLMVRSLNGKYIHDRSYDLLKLKEFDDAEFEIVDIIDGTGKMKDHAMFICATDEGHRFNCTLNAPMSELAEIWTSREAYIGKQLTVRYQGKTETDKPVPRFPKGIRFRED